MAEKYNIQKKKISSFEKEKRSLLGQIYELEKETSRLVRDKGKFDRDRIGLDEDVKKVSQSIISLERDLKKSTKQVMKRWVQIQKMQDLPWMYVFLSSYSPSELERVLKSFEHINKNESQVIEEYLKKLETLRQEKIKLHGLAKNLVQTNKKIVSKEKSIKSQHLRRKKLLARLNGKISSTKKSMKSTQKMGKKLAGLHKMDDLKMLFNSSFFEKKGQLPHPIDTPIKHPYGLYQTLLKDNVKLLHKGFFYSARPGEPVQAISEGRVRFAKRQKKRGHTVIIDHGSNYYSVYTYLQKLKVKPGDLVKNAAEIGQSGNFKSSLGTGLYFEIRHFWEPEDPGRWLKKRVNKDKLAKIQPSEEGAT